MAKILMLQGLQGSGKSTYAFELVDNGWVRTNKDDLRALMHHSKHSKGNESQVLAIRDAIIEDSLTRGRNVVVDDTGFNPVHEERLRELAKKHSAIFAVKFFDTDIDTCIKRDLQRTKSVGEKVIRQTWQQYLAPKPQTYNPPEGKPEAYLFDIDGTLAHGINITRRPYEWDKVGSDTVDKDLPRILMSLKEYNIIGDPEERVNIILISGRDSICRPETEKWLQDNNIHYDQLFMRPEGDKRKDYDIKEEIFNQYIRDNYRIRGVFDDRPIVCRMWRNKIGLTVYQVGDPYIEF